MERVRQGGRRGFAGRTVGGQRGFSELLLRGSRPALALAESGPGGGNCKRRGPDVGMSWVCSRNRKEALGLKPFTSLLTAPQASGGRLLTQGARAPPPCLGADITLVDAPTFAPHGAGSSRKAEET